MGTASTVEDCKEQCLNKTTCEYFTWFEDDNECLLFTDCNFNATLCTDCYTGAADCSPYTCFNEGVCINATFIDYDYFTSSNDCLEFCKGNQNCKWFNFDPQDNNICVLTSDCPETVTGCVSSGCVYGQVECEPQLATGQKIMVATGVGDEKLDNVEVIDMDAIASCPNSPVEYIEKVDYAVAMKHNNKMVICGGNPRVQEVSSDCYSYSDNQWIIEAFKLEPARYGAMSVEIRPGEWLVMGGKGDSSSYLEDTQLLKNGIFLPGPDLQANSYGGSSVMLNSTHLFVALGDSGHSGDSEYAPNNYLLNIDTDQWTRIPDRMLQPYYFHSSGTFFNSSAGEHQVANIGRYGIEVYSPRDDSWHQVPFPSPLTFFYYSVAVQNGTDSFILIGGYTNVDTYSPDIYSFDENGLSLLKEDVLKVPRRLHVALPISNDDFNCV